MTTKKKETGKKPAGTKPHGSATAASILGHPVVKVKKNGEVKIKSEWTKFYQHLLELCGLIGADTFELFTAIQTQNPYAAEVVSAFVEEAQALSRASTC